MSGDDWLRVKDIGDANRHDFFFLEKYIWPE
jgi:hypothetical protein